MPQRFWRGDLHRDSSQCFSKSHGSPGQPEPADVEIVRHLDPSNISTTSNSWDGCAVAAALPDALKGHLAVILEEHGLFKGAIRSVGEEKGLLAPREMSTDSVSFPRGKCRWLR